MNNDEICEPVVVRDLAAEISEWIEWNRSPDELTGRWIKNRISRIQHPIETRLGRCGKINRCVDMTVAKCGVVTPVSVEQFVTPKADSGKESIREIVKFLVSKFEKGCLRVSGNDLLKWIKGVVGAWRNAGVGTGRPAHRRARRMRGDGNSNAVYRLKREGGSRPEIVTHVISLEKHVAVGHHLLTEYFVIGHDECAVSLCVWQFARKMVDWKMS